MWGTVANAVAMVIVFSGRGRQGGRRAASLAAMAAWLALVGGSEVWRSSRVYQPYFDSFRAQTLGHEQILGAFARTGDASEIEGAAFPRIPMFSGDGIIATLRDPQVLALFPAPLRRDFVRDRQPSLLDSERDGPLSFAALRAEECGPAIALAGAAMVAGALLLARRAAAGLKAAGT
jgi:hypothetical protein